MRKIILIATLLCLFTSCSNNNLKFKKEDYENNWPFSVDEIEVYWAGYKEIYCKDNAGKIYALNGSAKSASRNNSSVTDVSEIWLDNPEFPGTKIPYSDFIDRGLQLCEEK